MTREELIKTVALKMDEISSSNDILITVNSGDNNPLYTQINSLINESVNDVLMKAPIYRLQSHIESYAISTAKTIFGGLRKVAVFAVPADFVRFVSIQDNLFQRPIVTLAIEGDDMDKRQHNKHLVAKSAKPVAVLGNTGTSRIITCYSYDTSATPAPTMLFIERYEGDDTLTSDVGLDDYMIDLVSWVCAGRVFAAQGDVNKGKICDENAAALMI